MIGMLPADGHVHSEWSWDAFDGAMEQTCTQAVALGLPAIAFTEHVDHTAWLVMPGELDPFPRLKAHLTADDVVVPPRFDAEGYLECLNRCRARFPDLRIISGVELGEPHRHPEEVANLLSSGAFERVLGSLHSLPLDGGYAEPPNHFRRRATADVIRDYLAEVPRMVDDAAEFAVLAHIDYAVRYWPDDAEPFDPYAFEDEFRHALRVLADGGRALEINTRGPMHPEIVRWWYDEGGELVTFGSDAHTPAALAFRFTEAAAMAEAQGFRPGRHAYDFWRR